MTKEALLSEPCPVLPPLGASPRCTASRGARLLSRLLALRPTMLSMVVCLICQTVRLYTPRCRVSRAFKGHGTLEMSYPAPCGCERGVKNEAGHAGEHRRINVLLNKSCLYVSKSMSLRRFYTFKFRYLEPCSFPYLRCVMIDARKAPRRPLQIKSSLRMKFTHKEYVQ